MKNVLLVGGGIYAVQLSVRVADPQESSLLEASYPKGSFCLMWKEESVWDFPSGERHLLLLACQMGTW